MLSRYRSLFALSILSLSACTQDRVPVVDYGNSNYNQALITREETPVMPSANASVTVGDKDTLLKIASRHKVPMRDIILLNHLKSPYRLKKGTVLLLPTSPYHTVTAGETLLKIARANHLSEKQLIEANHLTPPYGIRKGQMLSIPTSMPAHEPQLRHAAAQVPAAANVPPTMPIVNVTSSSVKTAALPPLQQVHVSEYHAPSTTSESVPMAPAPVVATIVATPSAPVVQSVRSSPPPAPAPAPVLHTADGRPIWPVKGKIISRFGVHKGGLYNDGVNIAAAENTPIHAIASGIIVYAGNELRGYGNLTIIKHPNGMITAYAHQRDMLVKKGQQVSQGQVIGHVGQTGNVSQPQLHFGIRAAGKAVNPELYLPPM